MHDALAAFDGPVVELHLSNPGAREEWRATSVITPVATGIVSGFGGFGYRLAVMAAAELLTRYGDKPDTAVGAVAPWRTGASDPADWRPNRKRPSSRQLESAARPCKWGGMTGPAGGAHARERTG